MPKKSAGILLFRRRNDIEVFLVHPGGPFFKNKDLGSWTIPKGEIQENEDPLDAAIREFKEETGFSLTGEFIPLRAVTQKAGKQVMCWCIEGDLDAQAIQANTFNLEWPPRSGKMQSFPEVDRAEWFMLDQARQKLNSAQADFLDQLVSLIQTKKPEL